MNKCTPVSTSSTCSNFLCKNSESHRIVPAHLALRLRLRSITLPLELRASYCAVASQKHSSAVGSVRFTQAISVTLTLKTNAHQFKLNCSTGKYVMQQLKKIQHLVTVIRLRWTTYPRELYASYCSVASQKQEISVTPMNITPIQCWFSVQWQRPLPHQKNVKRIVYAEPWIYVDLYYSLFLRAIDACGVTNKLDGYDDDAVTYLLISSTINQLSDPSTHLPKT